MVPSGRRLQDGEKQLTSEISEAQYRGTEYKSHRQSLEIEIARLKSGVQKFLVRSGTSPIDQ